MNYYSNFSDYSDFSKFNYNPYESKYNTGQLNPKPKLPLHTTHPNNDVLDSDIKPFRLSMPVMVGIAAVGIYYFTRK
jgi:hypothetical protein